MAIQHEIVLSNPDLDVQFYLSFDHSKTVAPHWHNNIEFIYILDGTSKFKIDNKTISVNTEELFIVNSRAIHSVQCGDNKTLVLQIPLSLLAKYVSNYDLLYFNIDMHKQSTQRLKQIFLEMYEIYKTKPDAYLLKFNSLLYDLLYIIIKDHAKYMLAKDIIKNNKAINKIKHIMLYINKHHHQNLNLQDIAAAFGYNKDYLARFFKKYLNMTIIQYLYECRIHYAYKDLIKKNAPVHEILESHGCFNYKLTMQIFKQKYGMTPKELQTKFHLNY